jgi:hypothetical protein
MVTLNGWFVLIIDGGPLRKHNVFGRARWLSTGFEEGVLFGLSLGHIVET